MLSKAQRIEGITSKCLDEPKEKHLHYPFFDLEKCTLEEAKEKLLEIQKEFRLGDIYIFSDKEESFRAWCFSKRSFVEYIHILVHSFPLLDYGFFIWTVRRGGATLRISNKADRPSQKCVAFLSGYEKTALPQKAEFILYDTGLEKQGKTIQLGGN
jgi:hypothetical protein